MTYMGISPWVADPSLACALGFVERAGFPIPVLMTFLTPPQQAHRMAGRGVACDRWHVTLSCKCSNAIKLLLFGCKKP